MSTTVKALTATGLVLLALHEGFSANPYYDSVGVLTNGFGNTHSAERVVTVPQALEDLNRNVLSASQAVNTCVKVPVEQHVFDAFTSLTFNIGNKAFCNSTLVKKANRGDIVGACKEILRWDFAGGKKLKGLTIRRRDEYNTCMGV